MNYFPLRANKKTMVNGLILFAFILISNTNVVAQTVNNVADLNTIEVSVTVKKESVSAGSSSSSMNFVLWFMGSKQDPNSAISTEGSNTKKQVITSGVAPNRLLIKAFLKKAVNLESMVA
ncbi:hypothetical protein SAMN05444395_10529 [Flavobacterium fryxellicola]|uniref:Uncharacterized protein n=1 Tax=Flavobacterium fryxellicola TaxID=249352 RepID=A0A167UZY0_9FLAO|nr:hypothetical protein [Flavobacterium fryxellicola]OAB25956.1 hypothetical protein FBFR_13635 [Flavobacterium fryxellicola]SHN69099.1 hypothetical protein SAMN05444395_10529 [Flavobacterium fryxellicola]